MRVLLDTHAVAVHALPSLHGDPFDRVLVAQVPSEPMRLVTHDATVASYDPAIMRVQGPYPIRT